MSQRLILPITKSKIVAGYKVPAYAKPKAQGGWGYPHYGIDYNGDPKGGKVYASGDGLVVLAGKDTGVGNTVAILYKDCYNHKTGKTCNLVARYMHLASISVTVGAAVKAGTLIGIEGNTGAGGWAVHLHVEFDTDTKNPAYSPQVAGSNLIKASPKGYPDTTINPSDYFYVGAGQTVTNGNTTGWTWSEDYNLPKMPTESAEITALKSRNATLEAENAQMKADIAGLAAKYK